MNDQGKYRDESDKLVTVMRRVNPESEEYISARNDLLVVNLGVLAHYVILRLHTDQLLNFKNDVINEICISFIKAVDKHIFEKKEGNPVHYGYVAAKRDITEALTRARDVVRVPTAYYSKNNPYHDTDNFRMMTRLTALDKVATNEFEGSAPLVELVAGEEKEISTITQIMSHVPLHEIRRIMHNAITMSKRLTAKHKQALYDYFHGQITMLAKVLRYAIKLLEKDTETKNYIKVAMRNYYA